MSDKFIFFTKRTAAVSILAAAALTATALTASCSLNSDNPAETASDETLSDTMTAETVSETDVTPIPETSAAVSETETSASTAPTTAAKPEATEEEFSEEQPLSRFTTEQDITDFLSDSEWQFINTSSGISYAEMSFTADGEAAFRRIADGLTACGGIELTRIYADENELPDGFAITFDDIDDGFSDGTGLPEACEMNGIYRIVSYNGEDRLYLEEIGNGDSPVSYSIFPDPEDGKNTADGAGAEFVLCRESAAQTAADVKTNSEFYAFCWKNSGEKLLLQPITPQISEEQEEYSPRRFSRAVFVPESTYAAEYTVSEDISPAGLLYESRFGRYSPLAVYKVFTDIGGTVYKLEEIDEYMYGTYDLGSAEQDFSYNGRTFVFNGTEFPLPAEISSSDSITDCEQVGDKIVITGHINDTENEYIIFDINSQQFIKTIHGSDFVWRDDNVYFSYYISDGIIYDYSGNIAAIPESGYESVNFNDETSIEVWYPGQELPGTQPYSVIYDYAGSYDLPIYAYIDYLRSRKPSAWRNFMKYAPENAAMFIITNPDTEITEQFAYYPAEGDTIAAVPLYDNAAIRLDSGTYIMSDSGNYLWDNVTNGTEQYTYKGGAVFFETALAEGIPSQFIYMYTEKFSVDSAVRLISGKDPIRCEFVPIIGAG